MEFRLVYEGRLPAASSSSRAKEKQEIRKVLHPQLRQLWQTHPRLRSAWLNLNLHMDHHATKAQFGFRLLPLVCNYFDSVCALDILFLRRDKPGDLVTSGGDIDNRLKVLLDALRIPQSQAEIAGATPGQDEDPFCCLLEDDKLVTELHVTTDQLFTPPKEDEGENDVHLIIHVKTIPLNSPTL
jgi:hypothetical protein